MTLETGFIEKQMHANFKNYKKGLILIKHKQIGCAWFSTFEKKKFFKEVHLEN